MPFDKNNPKTRRRRKVCQFCVDKATFIDYKDTAKLRRFLSERSNYFTVASHGGISSLLGAKRPAVTRPLRPK